MCVSKSSSIRIGSRICLLKGCEKSFRPYKPLARYCSVECQAAARKWKQRLANQRYRASPKGLEARRLQCTRYRDRLRESRALMQNSNFKLPSESSVESISHFQANEGYHQNQSDGKNCCHRPGCYEQYIVQAQSPLKKFCSIQCRNALRRVRIRERRWLRRLKLTPAYNPKQVTKKRITRYIE